MSDDRLVQIETKLAHQEHLLLELDSAITKQQETIMHLQELCGFLVERLRAVSEVLPREAAPDEKPPHY